MATNLPRQTDHGLSYLILNPAKEVPDDAPIADKIKKGVTLENVYIMNELSGLVLDVEGGGGAGSNVI